MNKDLWTHTQTAAQYGTNGPLGSPRSWLRRSLDVASLDDTTFQPGSLTTGEISIAGVWYKTENGYGLPITGMHRELFRWFDIPAPSSIASSRTTKNLHRAIGVAAAVPLSEVLHWIAVYKEHGAAFTWWNTPINAAIRAVDPTVGRRERRKLDHAAVYKLLDAGKTRVEISKILEFPAENIDYVIRKWRAGLPLGENFKKPKIDAAALLSDYANGYKARELAVVYNTSESYVYKLIGESKKWQDLNQQ